MLKFLVKASGASLVSPTQSLAQIGDVIFRVPPRHDTPAVLSLLVVVGADRRLSIARARAPDSRRRGGRVTATRSHRARHRPTT